MRTRLPAPTLLLSSNPVTVLVSSFRKKPGLYILSQVCQNVLYLIPALNSGGIEKTSIKLPKHLQHLDGNFMMSTSITASTPITEITLTIVTRSQVAVTQQSKHSDTESLLLCKSDGRNPDNNHNINKTRLARTSLRRAALHTSHDFEADTKQQQMIQKMPSHTAG